MRPYYDEDGITLYHGDCLEGDHAYSKGEPGSLLLTDPPYGVNLKTDYRSRGRSKWSHDWPPIQGDDKPFDPSPWVGWGDIILWGADHYHHKLPPGGWLIWDKRLGHGINDQADVEMAWTSIKGPARVFYHNWNGFRKDSERGKSYHPTQKPVALMAWCIKHTARVSGQSTKKIKPLPKWVLDPYAGAGPVAVACQVLRIPYVGYELEESYLKTAVERLRQRSLPLESWS